MYDEHSLLKVIDEMKTYLRQGEMNNKQIEKMIKCLQEIYIRENIMSYKMDNEDDENLENYIRNHLTDIATVLNRSVATVYRKLHNHSFTLVELQMIENMRICYKEIETGREESGNS